MSTTPSNARALRAAARSARASSVVSGGARSTAGRSLGGRTPRRGAPATVAADPPQDDHDEIPRGMQAYGTQGQPDEALLEPNQLGLGHGANQVIDALADIDNNANPNTQPTTLLPPINEVNETDTRGTDTNINNLAPQFVNHTSLISRFSSFFWGPRNPADAGWENEIRHRQQRFIPDNIPKWLSILLVLLALVAAVAHQMNVITKLNDNSSIANVTVNDYNILKHRVALVEHHLQNIASPTPSVSSTETQVNWFAAGSFPLIDVHLSSPTTTFCDPTWKPWPFSSLLRQKCPELPISPPAKMALLSTDEPMQDRWCSPKSSGKLQLVIEIMRPIIPTELVVEYQSMQSTPTGFMGVAPKEIELWIEVEDDEVRAKSTEAIGRLHPELLEESSPQHKTLEASRELGPLYIPVGRWIYNIYDPINVQGLRLLTPLLELGVETTKLAIRVNSNWGSVDYTCLNRLRMHGVDTSGITEFLEDPPWRS